MLLAFPLRTSLVSALLLTAAARAEGPRDEARPAEVRLDWATYNPSSLVLRKFGWLEEALGKDGIRVRWLYSAGSNKANEALSSGSADFASTAGAAALLARTNGVPLKVVYVYSKPEWTALVGPVGVEVDVTHDIDEALFLSDRVVVLRGRPARIEDTLDVGLPRPRDRRDAALGPLRAHLLEALRLAGDAHAAAPAEPSTSLTAGW